MNILEKRIFVVEDVSNIDVVTNNHKIYLFIGIDISLKKI